MDISELLTFRKMIAPTIIQILFYIGLAAVVIMALLTMMQGGMAVLIGFVWLILGPIGVRVYCELVIVMFRILDVLTEIRDGKKA